MTGDPARDIEPPSPPPTIEPAWELQVGHNLEDAYCAYNEALVFITRGLQDFEIARMQDMGGWAADRLRELRVDSAMVDRFEEALTTLPSTDEFPRAIDERWLAARSRVSADIDLLLRVARMAVEPHRTRYYDYGVMLCRIRQCMQTLRVLSSLPADLAEAFSHFVPTYRKELLRTTAVIQRLVAHEGPDLPRDPGQHDLDRRFSEFADYLAIWRTGDAQPDDEFRQQLNSLSEHAGFRRGDQAKQELTWKQHREPLAETDRMPLPVPHSSQEREQLEAFLETIRGIAVGGEFERALDLTRDLLKTCRTILGPVHPVTLHTQVEFSAMHGPVGKIVAAVLMLLDAANTALHYYGPYHPARYLIIAHAHSYLQLLDPREAQELYDFPLKSLVESEEGNLPPALHQARRTIRQSMNLDAEPRSDQ